MPILAGGQRRYLFDKGLSYLFSFDVSLADAERMTGDAVGGTWIRCVASPPADLPEKDRERFLVYHVHDDLSVGDNDSITGQVCFARAEATFADAQRVGAVEGALLIQTEDGAVIDSRYQGCLLLGSLGINELWMKGPEPRD